MEAPTPVRFDALTLSRLRREASAEGVSLSEVVRRAVEEHLTARGKATDLLRDSIYDAMTPHVRSLAALSAAAVVEAATAKWLAAAIVDVLPLLPKGVEPAYRDAEEVMAHAYGYAMADLKAHRDAGGVTRSEGA